MPQLALEHATIEYQDLGPADSQQPVVVFIHGALVDNRLWVKAAERLASNGFRCVLPNLPLGSHTIPVGPGADLSPRGVATMIRDFVDALGLQDVTLVGNDTGGALCQIFVDAYPERVGRLVLTNCDAFDKFPPFPFSVGSVLLLRPATIKATAGLMRLTVMRHSPLGYGLLWRNPDPALTESWLAPSANDPRIRQDIATLTRNIGRTNLTEVSNRMTLFTKPVTIVWGQGDRSFTPALGRRLAAKFPNVTTVDVPGARTFVALEDPDAVADAVAAIGAHTA